MMGLFFSLIFMIFSFSFLNWYISCFFIMFMCFYTMNSFVFVDFFSGLVYGLGADLMSLSLIILSMWIIFLMILASSLLYNKNCYVTEFLLLNFMLLFFLILSFSVSNLFMFYLFFECTLIPTLLLIFGWGYQPERLMAGYYLLFYTLFFSMPLLLGIFYINNFSNTTFYFLINIDMNLNLYMYLCMIMAFLVKMPMVFVHFWLPKAHVEAPISGSMILAGVLLKLGGYGLIRVFLFMNFYFPNIWFISLSLFGMFMVGFLCMFQIDMKSLIAYSSVAHMGMVICGIFSLNLMGILGSLVLMIGHGLCSSGMFCLANIVYERTMSRSLFINKGLLTFMPSMCLFWFLIMINNMSSPPSLNLLGEIMLINGIMSWSYKSFFLLMISSFLSCLYSMYLYSCLNHGDMYKGMYSGSVGYFIEYYLIFLHWFPLNLLILKVDIFSLML